MSEEKHVRFRLVHPLQKDFLPSHQNIWIFKGLLSDDERLYCLDAIKKMPEELWTQSVCTDYEVSQLREHMPLSLYNSINKYCDKIKPTLEHVTKEKLNINYADMYQMMYGSDMVGVTLDRRTEGQWLGPHNDVPTGDFEGHIGTEKGKSYLEITTVYYWNDDFEGGELEFYDPGISDRFLAGEEYQEPFFKYKPVAGDLVAFMHDIPEHMITPVTSGVRYSSQTFFNRTRNPK
jgi:hypothetical protein